MLIYHRVNSVPRDPLLVGPLPQRVPPSAPPSGVEDHGFRPPSGPVGPIPFFPPKGPVLLIGPLPKPLQPKGILSSSQEFEEIFFDTAATPPRTGGRGSEQQADSPSEGTLQEMGISLKSSLGDFSISLSQRNTSVEVTPLSPANRTGNNLATIIETPEDSRIGDTVETLGNQSLQISFKDTNNQNLSVFLLSTAEGTLFPTLKLHSVSASLNNTTTESYSNISDLYLQSITNITKGRDNDTEYKTSQPLKTNTTQSVITLLSASKTPTPLLHLETPDKEYPFPPDLDLQREIAPTENTSHHPMQSPTTDMAVASDLPSMTSAGNSFSRAPSSAVVIMFDSSLPSTHTPARPFTHSTDETSAASRMEEEVTPTPPLTDNSRTVAEPTTSADLPPLFYLPVETSVNQADSWNQLRRQR